MTQQLNEVLVKNQSFKFKLYFYLITIPVVPYFFIILMISHFISSAHWVVEQQLSTYSNWRWQLLKPLYQKDNLFNIIKQSDN